MKYTLAYLLSYGIPEGGIRSMILSSGKKTLILPLGFSLIDGVFVAKENS